LLKNQIVLIKERNQTKVNKQFTINNYLTYYKKL